MRISFIWILLPAIVLVFSSLSLVRAQTPCDTLYIPRGNMYPPERRELCQQDTIILQGISPEENYQLRWFRNNLELFGETQPILRVSQPGTYSFRYYSEGCYSSSYDTIRIRYRNQPRPKARQLSLQQAPASPGSQLSLQVQSIGNAGSVSHNWFRNDILDANSGLALTGRNPGRYRVRTDSAGCFSYSNEILVRPAGSFIPKVCLSEPTDSNGLRIEWIPPSDGRVKRFYIYRKRYYESAFSLVDSVSPAWGVWIGSNILAGSSVDVIITARVTGTGGEYESEPSALNQTLYLKVNSSPQGFTPRNVLTWNSYKGFDVSLYYIYRNESLLDSVSGTSNVYVDRHPLASPFYGIEAAATGNCTSAVTDQEGNSNETVQIGNQVWMKENLRVSKYRNGDTIVTNLSDAAWNDAFLTQTGAYVRYEDNPTNDNLFGKLYNWYAVSDPRGLCPAGWHVPSDDEWKILESYLGMPSAELENTGFRGGNQNVGGKLKAVSNLWTNPNSGASDESGFSGLPGGYKYFDGPFNSLNSIAYWWSSSEYLPLGTAWSRGLIYNDNKITRDGESNEKTYGFSVRCLQDKPETGSIDSLDCDGAIQMNYLAENSPAENVQIILPCFGANGGNYNGQSISSSGVTGLSAVLNAGNFNNGNDSLIYSITGTPSGIGTAVFNISIGGKQCSISLNAADTGSVRDIDGNLYTTIKIGNQEWMQENLKVKSYHNGDTIIGNLTFNDWKNFTNGAYAVYEDNLPNDTKFGKLYNWYAVVDPRGLCPVGFHVPTEGEWWELTNLLGGQNVGGGKLKKVGNETWVFPNLGATNSCGFNGIPAGNRYEFAENYSYAGAGAYWWSSTQYDFGNAYRVYVYYNIESISIPVVGYKQSGLSIRCLKDGPETGLIDSLDCAGKVQTNFLTENSPAFGVKIIVPYSGGNGGSYNSRNIASSGVTGLTANILNGNFSNGNDSLIFSINGLPSGFGTAVFNISIGGKQCSISLNVADTGSVKDIDGNSYSTIKIGNQEWMQQNLTTGKFRNGDPIPGNPDNISWQNSTSAAFSIYNGEATNDSLYGKLYNWYAVEDPRGLCPTGWHVPTDNEWYVLENYLDPSISDPGLTGFRGTSIGSVMKTTGTKQSGSGLWESPNTDGRNSSGFQGLPGGARYQDGAYDNLGLNGLWWSSSSSTTTFSWARGLSYNNSQAGRYDDFKTSGFSVRCLKD